MGVDARQADCYEGVCMEIERKLFGELAFEKGFVTAAQLYKALTVQAKAEARGEPYRFLGEILLELGYLHDRQVLEILNELHATENAR
jgi:hypothetical protein